MNAKIEYLYERIEEQSGYMVVFIRVMHDRILVQGEQASYSHNESRFIERAYAKLRK